MELPQRVALMAHVTVLTDRPATARLNGYQKPTDHGRTDGGWEAATDHGPFVSRTSKAPARQPLQIRTGWPDPPRPGKSETAPVTSPGYGMRFDTSTLSRGWRPRWASECPTSSRVSSERLRLTQTIRTFDVGWRSVRVRSPAGSSGLPFVDLDADRHERLAHGARNHEPDRNVEHCGLARGCCAPLRTPASRAAPGAAAGRGAPAPPNPVAGALMTDRRTVMVAARVSPPEHAAWRNKAAAAGHVAVRAAAAGRAHRQQPQPDRPLGQHLRVGSRGRRGRRPLARFRSDCCDK